MTPVTDPATDSRVVRLYPSPLNTGTLDLDTVTLTADSIVRDILQLVAAGRIDDDARAAFRDWIVDAWLALPTAIQMEQLCQAAGFASVVDPVTLKARIDELHATHRGATDELGSATNTSPCCMRRGRPSPLRGSRATWRMRCDV